MLLFYEFCRTTLYKARFVLYGRLYMSVCLFCILVDGHKNRLTYHQIIITLIQFLMTFSDI